MKVSRRNTHLLASCTLTLVLALTSAAEAQQPISTRRSDHVDRFQGFSVSDPYRWLEEVGSPDARRWIKSQDSLTRSLLDSLPERKAAFARISKGFLVPDTVTLLVGPPQKRGTRYFAIKVGPRTRPAIAVYDGALDGPGRDIKTAIPPTTRWLASPDGRYVIYYDGRAGAWRIADVARGADLADSIVAGPQSTDSIAWLPSGEGFYYTRSVPRPTASADGPPDLQHIAFHRVGTAQANDSVIFSQSAHPHRRLRPEVSEDGAYLLITAARPYEVYTRYYMLERNRPGATLEPLVARGDASYAFLGIHDGRLVFSTTLQAPRGRIVSVDPLQPTRQWRTIVPQSPMTINEPALRGGRLVVLYNKDALPTIRIFDLSGRLEREVALPEGGMGSPWWNPSGKPEFMGSAKDPEVFFVMLSPFAPQAIYRFDVTSGETTRLSRNKPSFSADDYAIRQVFYRSKDGTRVPMLLAHRKGLQPDSTTPVWLSTLGGAFGWSSFYWFFPSTPAPALIEMGGIVALPGARGGSEYGMDWRLAGRGATKQRSIDDFIAAAEWLVSQGYGSRRTLVLNGADPISALAGAVLNQRPELFGAAIMTHPLFDLLRMEQLPGGWIWAPEFGSTREPTQLETLRKYSPYHNVRANTCYPPTLVITGENDVTDHSSHAYKQVAAWQHAQACPNPIRLSVIAGQGYSSSGAPTSVADQLGFLMHALRIEPSRLSP